MCTPSMQTIASKKGDAADTKPTQVSGFDRRRREIEFGLLFLSIVYGVVFFLNPDITAHSKYCPEGEQECHRPDLIAYKVASALCMFYMGLSGVYNWHFTKRIQNLASKSSSAEDRLFGYLEASDYQNVAIFCYQVWDFVVSLTIPEHFDAIFLTHHALAAVTAFFSLEYQMLSYYSLYFGGCSEFSSIFLVFADMDEFFPPTPDSAYANFILACKAMFTLTFTYYRVVGWIQQSFHLWRDCLNVIRSGSVEKHRPGKSYFLYVFMGLDFILGCLQCFWFVQIVAKIVEMVAEK